MVLKIISINTITRGVYGSFKVFIKIYRVSDFIVFFFNIKMKILITIGCVLVISLAVENVKVSIQLV